MKIDDYLERLISLRDEYSDVIPDEMLIGTQDSVRYKAKKSWFQRVIADTGNIILDGYASESARECFEKFIKYCREDEVSYHPTKDKDIVNANKLLSSFINDLENKTASAGSSSF